MARKGNQQKNGLDGTTFNNKKGKGKGNVSNLKDVKKEELPNDAQPNISVTDSLHKKKTKSGRQVKVESQTQSTAGNGTSSIEQSEVRDGNEDCNADMATTGSSGLEEEKLRSNESSSIPRSKNRKSNSSVHSLNGFDEDGLPETVEIPEPLGVKYLKTFMLSVSKASSEWFERHKPLFDVLVTKILISREYVRSKVKHGYPIVMKWLTHLTNILLLISMVWLDCVLRGMDSVIRMGTTSFFAVIWCGIFSVVAMIGMLKFVTVGAIVALVALFVGFTIGLLLLAISGVVFLWLYGSFWTTLLVLLIGGIAFTFSHERVALLIMTVYSVYSAWTLVGWLGFIVALNFSFFSSDALMFFLRNNMNEQRRSADQNGPGVFNGEEQPRSSFTDGGTGTNPTGDRSPGVPSTSGSDELTSEDEVVRLLNSVDHYSAFGLSRFQEVDAAFLKKEYRKKAMLVHPDKNMGNEKAAEAFKKLQNGYEVLLDTSKRKTYDDELRREDLVNYFRRFQNATPKNKRNGLFGSSPFGRTEVHVDDPLGESRRIACPKCNSFHMWFYTKKTKSRARSCQDCKDFHPAKDGDGWVEQSSQPLLFGIFQKVDLPRAYVCADSKIYDATEWYICQGMRCPANTHKPSFHVNTSVMSKHSNSSSKGASSSRNGNGNGNGMPNVEESMTEEEFMEWLQNAVQSGMFDNFAGNASDVPSNTTTPKTSGGNTNSNSKRKKKGKKW